jgi:molybdenum cofactor biosynthesis protein B
MSQVPHPNSQEITVHCAVITVSDTRTPETDRSGQLIQQLLGDAGHVVNAYQIIPDEPDRIQSTLKQWCQREDLDTLIF